MLKPLGKLVSKIRRSEPTHWIDQPNEISPRTGEGSVALAFIPASESLKANVREFMDRNRGRLYMPIPHPDFQGWPVSRGTERFGMIEPHLDHRGGTALDVGTHFGAFAHWLEDLGYQVTAVEQSNKYARIANQVRDLCGKQFTVVRGSIFDLEKTDFDIVLALNIFHHFLKDQKRYDALREFLARLQCRTMIFQSHDVSEGQMTDAYRNMGQEEFARFVSQEARLPNVVVIGSEGPRSIFKLTA